MRDDSARIRATILGSGEAARTPSADRTAIDLAVEASLAAVEDAGVELGRVDGLVTGYSLTENHLDFSGSLAEALGITPQWSQTISRSGATGASTVVDAALAVSGGVCDTALAVWADNRRSRPPADVAGLLAGQLSEFETMNGPLIATQYALIAQSYLDRWRATPEDLASVAVQFRRHASLNAHARHREPISVEDVLASPIASSPLHVLECALITDYGGAVVVIRPEFVAGAVDPVRILGAGEALSHQSILRNPALFTTGETAGAESAWRAHTMAGTRPADIRSAQIYDCFTITVLMLLEDFDFAPRGGAGELVRGGGLDRDGAFPVNTNGGMLSCASGGILHVTEAVAQMRGRAGGHQLTIRPETSLVHGNGGILGAQTTLILGQE